MGKTCVQIQEDLSFFSNWKTLAKPPNMVWGEACNVADKSPIKPGARRVARRCYKRAEVSWVWPMLAILVRVNRVRYKAIWRFGAI